MRFGPTKLSLEMEEKRGSLVRGSGSNYFKISFKMCGVPPLALFEAIPKSCKAHTMKIDGKQLVAVYNSRQFSSFFCTCP